MYSSLKVKIFKNEREFDNNAEPLGFVLTYPELAMTNMIKARIMLISGTKKPQAKLTFCWM